jgi:hypothetical protein
MFLMDAEQLCEKLTLGGLLPDLLLPVLLLLPRVVLRPGRSTWMWKGHTVSYHQE